MSDLTTPELCRILLTNGATDTTYDERIATLLPLMSELARSETSRRFDREDDATKIFGYRAGQRRLSIVPFELRSVDSIVVAGTTETTLDASAYKLRPAQATPEGTYLWIEFLDVLADEDLDLDVTGDWGTADIPLGVSAAVADAVHHAIRNPESFQSRSLGGFSISEPQEVSPGDGLSLPAASRAKLRVYRRMVV